MDTDCSVCYTTMVEPCTLPCNHSFCLQCIRAFFQTKSECPLCRDIPPAKFKLNVNTKLQQQVRRYVPEAYAERVAALRAQNAFSSDWVDLKLIYGNRHEDVPAMGFSQNTHKWTMFVKAANPKIDTSQLFEKVRYGLHESFCMTHKDIRAGKNKQYEMTFTGWGTFEIPLMLFLKRELGYDYDKRTMELNHSLSFEGKGKWRTFILPIKKTVAK